jgi:FkbM family methyltransferase
MMTDGAPGYIVRMLMQAKPHDDDYHVFRVFDNPDEVILDIGANWGYSASSIWAVGSRCRVVSFEPVPVHRDCLATIKRLYPQRYEYRLIGLSNRSGILNFVVPVVNGTAVSALASAVQQPDIDRVTEDIYNYICRWRTDKEELLIKLCEICAPVERLDRILRNDYSILGPHRIAAIKVDVEGLEFYVLKGATATLKNYTPLVMVEGGNRPPELADYMATLGYTYAERRGMLLTGFEGTSKSCNGFFVHRKMIESYRRIGVYV